jgi:hypothetical protein
MAEDATTFVSWYAKNWQTADDDTIKTKFTKLPEEERDKLERCFNAVMTAWNRK